MHRIKLYLCLVYFLLFTAHSYGQQKNICISEELSNNSDKLKVKLGTKWPNRIWNFEFGNYKVVESKTGWVTETAGSNLLGTKSETETKYKFAFRLINKEADTAIVKANNNSSIQEVHSIELFKDFYIGDDQIVNQTEFFISSINLSNDKEDPWALLMSQFYNKNQHYEKIAFLQNNERNIAIAEVSSRECSDDKQRFPALGFEFIENEQAIGAVQYVGRGTFGTNKNIVWLKSDLDQKSKLILAAAMAALMEIKLAYFGGNDED